MFNPRLSDLFFWHFHPEYELVYISGANGNRHVGDHLSAYEGSDLVLIGSLIPHLNFDYGVETDYQKVVVHLGKEFVEGRLMQTPELAFVNNLFQQAGYGLAFHGETKRKVGKELLSFDSLDPFEQYLGLLRIFKILSESEHVERLHDSPYSHTYSAREQGRLNGIYAFIDQHYHEKISLQEIADQTNLSKEAFCRYFKRTSGYTFTQFLNRYRVSQAKRILMSGGNVSDACFQCGFESLSYFNRVFKRITHENPQAFRGRYKI